MLYCYVMYVSNQQYFSTIFITFIYIHIMPTVALLTLMYEY